jgi:uncharacterized membrane protein YciS (DUF1049 family)
MKTFFKILLTLFVFVLVPIGSFFGLVIGFQTIDVYTDYPLEAGVGMLVGGIIGLILALILARLIWHRKEELKEASKEVTPPSI